MDFVVSGGLMQVSFMAFHSLIHMLDGRLESAPLMKVMPEQPAKQHRNQ